MSESNTTTRPFVEVFVKSSFYGREKKKPSVVCQQWLMMLRTLELKRLISLVVTPVHPDDPAKAYNDLFTARLFPVAWVMSGSVGDKDLTGMTIDSIESLETFLSEVGCPCLNPDYDLKMVRMAEHKTEDLYTSFMLYLKGEADTRLMNELKKLDVFLGQFDGRFLLGDELSSADCLLMPRLHHICLAGDIYKNLRIPRELSRLRNYIRSMHSLDAFKFSCGYLGDMIKHYNLVLRVKKTEYNAPMESIFIKPLSDEETDESVEADQSSDQRIEIIRECN